jgi:hypothetical protein
MRFPVRRRGLLLAGLLLPLGACQSIPGLGPDEAVRRLLRASAQRALTRIGQENGLHGDELVRIAVPTELGAAPAAQDALARELNGAAETASRTVAPVLQRAIRDLAVVGAAAILGGGPSAATDYLQRSMGESLFEALAPAVGDSLRRSEAGALGQALAAAPGVNFEGLRLDLARRASEAIYRAIGREEAAIRADPRLFDRATSATDWL